MKFSLSWLREHLETTATLEEITATLNTIGLEVEGVEDPGAALASFRTARIIEAVQHPNADRLRVCQVDAGEGFERVQVVCGAPNARAGLHVIFAPPGTHIPASGITIKAGKLRGEASGGMLCSLRELGLGEESDGIAELPEGTAPGQSYPLFARLDDPVIDIAITPNRGDALAVRGVARDLAAAGLGKLKPWLVETVEGQGESAINWRITYPEACPWVLGRTIRGVKNGPSPAWLRRRLESIGLRPISALVDITNFFTHDLGRPLHVFDADRIRGGELTICRGAGETFTALDGSEHVMTPDDCVIADSSGVLSLAGIMGGAESGVSEETTSVFVECALFDPVAIALAGRRHNLHSDARQRFERGVDQALPPVALEAATRMIIDLCGGVADNVVSAGAEPAWQRQAHLEFARLETLGGLVEEPDHAVHLLEGLGFEVRECDARHVVVDVPSWRNDIAMPMLLDQQPDLPEARARAAAEGAVAINPEVDLIEEVLRLRGLDSVPAVSLPVHGAVPLPALTPRQARIASLRRTLAARGLLETVGFSFVAQEQAAQFGETPASLHLLNPIAADLDQMRPTPLVNLLAAIRANAARGYPDIGLFEVGPGFDADGQKQVAAGIRSGHGARQPGQPARPVDLWQVKADALAALATMGAAMEGLSLSADAPAYYHPGRSGVIRQGPKLVLGHFGQLHPALLAARGIDVPVCAFTLYPDAVPEPKRRRKGPPALSAFQPLKRDFAFVVSADVPAEKLLKAVKGAERNLIVAVSLFDVYEGDKIPAGHKSLGIEITLQPMDGTLTDAEIEAVCERVVAAAHKSCNAVLRG
ncbi:phenylalanine--tRNA ligase subunit beta [Komagataeibacter nataicola]|uniref:Phenylalanine--tRNA ligase beta subunit n=1 Tax=Komagataeibacter nataicola TaxID=265960 RepID=A0A9N7GZH8_9PROT|nr:phenylalanine--tRNA ligase subunit beta [Komagataeibacter nataicola]AQU86564.1 phenylalanine--tRNA ligase subunit beta [Komagataeibacter nataicola]PYD66326.1 phenylalanine--tRNA ligase subunit beta [Komagataeibacter nataicola]WEQ56545.1 phenylalanine--tRNA ligase subunit beta [Komagataeibacter nataicola]WNM08040.1 phenylalanine--tRNA ligase subunit beta [Komagataeibacter nataicola]GBR22043.1 phenylalanyl-tRNA synthetase subunit beta [Komagataeibacter nataicola NRIC 0616]